MRLLFFLLLSTSFLYGYTTESGIVSFNEKIIDSDKFFFYAFEVDIENSINDPYLTKDDIKNAHEKLINGITENQINAGAIIFDVYEKGVVTGETVYDLSSPVASSINIRRKFKVYYGDYYFEFGLILRDELVSIITSNMEEYFTTIEEGKLLVWHNSSGFIDAWKKQECQSLLIELNRSFSDVLDSMEFTFPFGFSNDSNVRIREKPDLEASIVGKLQLDDEVIIIDKTPNVERIEGLSAKWYKIMTEDGLVGWSFGSFITEGAP